MMFMSTTNKDSTNWTINKSKSVTRRSRFTRKINYKYQTHKAIVGSKSKSQNQKIEKGKMTLEQSQV